MSKPKNYVALVDYLAAGLEIENSKLKTVQPEDSDKQEVDNTWWNHVCFYQFTEIIDTRGMIYQMQMQIIHLFLCRTCGRCLYKRKYKHNILHGLPYLYYL